MTTDQLHTEAARIGGKAKTGDDYALVDIRRRSYFCRISYVRQKDGTWKEYGR
jgi:hypothetical protein